MEGKSCIDCQWRGLLVNVCYRNKSPYLLEMVQDDDYCDYWEPDTQEETRGPDTREADHEI